MGISIGMVGLGAFGKGFAELFKKHPLVDRIALCDREPERVAEFANRDSWKDKFNKRDAYETLDDICKADLDALVIITQPWLHAAQCVQAMESGKHVYSAVPISCVPDGDEILHWCDKLMHYPTHSTSGPVSVMGTHALKVTAYGYRNRNRDPFFTGEAMSNEIALFRMSNGSVVRICECRELARTCEEGFSVFGTKGSYFRGKWQTNHRDDPMTARPLESRDLTVEEMRDPLPQEVIEAWADKDATTAYGGHGGPMRISCTSSSMPWPTTASRQSISGRRCDTWSWASWPISRPFGTAKRWMYRTGATPRHDGARRHSC